jgi:UDP:flavonoid glycosyltransferase YjiC (YdhE family)
VLYQHSIEEKEVEFFSHGIPQIVLPLWVDLYDSATRVELLGIGVWGSRLSAPDWKSDELGGALLKVTGNSDAGKKIRENSEELAKKFRARPGRSCAAEEIARLSRLGHA